MKILHTSDWHVGKVLKGRDRHDEHVAVLGSIVQAARDEDVDRGADRGGSVRDRGADRRRRRAWSCGRCWRCARTAARWS